MRIVATAPVPSIAREILAPIGKVAVLDGGAADILLEDAEVLLVRGTPVDAEMIDAGKELRVIARTGAGFDNIDLAAATASGIPVVYAPGSGARAVAEGAFALIVAAAKRLGELGQVVRSGEWWRRYEPVGLDLAGATLGIVGFGHIGSEVASLGSAVGMQIRAFDPALLKHAAANGVHSVAGSLEELVHNVDIVSLHCALTAETRGMVNAKLLSNFRPGSVFVNAARGAIVESEDALLEALTEGRLSAIGLDVFPHEPPDFTHPLYTDPRVLCTPHTIALTAEWNRGVFGSLVTSIQGLMSGGIPNTVLNPEVLQTR